MKEVKILTVCGCGTVSSSMLSEKLKDTLSIYGYEVITQEVSLNRVSSAVLLKDFDLIAYTSPVQGNYNIPVLNAVGFLTGFTEEEFLAEVLDILKDI